MYALGTCGAAYKPHKRDSRGCFGIKLRMGGAWVLCGLCKPEEVIKHLGWLPALDDCYGCLDDASAGTIRVEMGRPPCHVRMDAGGVGWNMV